MLFPIVHILNKVRHLFTKHQIYTAFVREYEKQNLPTMHDIITHWGEVMHICVGRLNINGSDNGLAPGRRRAIIWTNAGILLIGPFVTNLSIIFIGIYTTSFKKMRLKMSAKWRSFCLGLNANMYYPIAGFLKRSRWKFACSEICLIHAFVVQPPFGISSRNRPVSQMRALLAACREVAMEYDTFPNLLYVFAHKT